MTINSLTVRYMSLNSIGCHDQYITIQSSKKDLHTVHKSSNYGATHKIDEILVQNEIILITFSGGCHNNL